MPGGAGRCSPHRRAHKAQAEGTVRAPAQTLRGSARDEMNGWVEYMSFVKCAHNSAVMSGRKQVDFEPRADCRAAVLARERRRWNDGERRARFASPQLTCEKPGPRRGGSTGGRQHELLQSNDLVFFSGRLHGPQESRSSVPLTWYPRYGNALVTFSTS